MKIKKYIAPSFKEGTKKINEELGEDAVILSNRTIKRADGTEMYEIVAAVDTDSTPKQSESTKQNQSQPQKSDPYTSLGDKIFTEFDKIRFLLHDISEDVKLKNISDFNPDLNRLVATLTKFGLTEELAIKIIAKIKTEFNPESFTVAFKKVKNLIKQSILIDSPIEYNDESKNVVFFGPSGSGKSLTLVKLGVALKLINANKISIISADTHKVGGIEQMETYSSISGIPFKSAYSDSEIKIILDHEYDSEIRMIDTPGIAFSNEEELDNLNRIIIAANADYKFLIVPASINRLSLLRVIETYKDLVPYSIIITKTDEATGIGAIYEVARENKIGISYITTGQGIPNDIEVADKDLIADLILPDEELI